MKNDGHIKLTLEAIKKMQSNCNIERKLCQLPMFSSNVNYGWSNPKTSNRLDFVSAYIAYVLNLTAYNYNNFDPRGNLATRVAAVDFDYSWTHSDPEGQKYHFMRAHGESEIGAYIKSSDFIKSNLRFWVIKAKRDINNLNMGNADYMTKRTGVKYLSLALHCLQDSFSPAHTIRSWRERSLFKNVIEYPTGFHQDMGRPGNPAPIVKIFDYSLQQHGHPMDTKTPHSRGDMLSGSTHTKAGELAIRASQELIEAGLLSIFKGRATTDWKKFSKKWLKHNLH